MERMKPPKPPELLGTLGARVMVKATSSAVKGRPSCHGTPSRSLNSQMVGSTARHEVARPGTSCALAVRSVSVLKMCSASEEFGEALKKCGSSEVMEPPLATVRLGPAGA